MKRFIYISLLLFVVTVSTGVSYGSNADSKTFGIENVNYHPPTEAVTVDKIINSATIIYAPAIPAQTLIACDKAITETPVKGYASVVEVNTARCVSEVYKHSDATGWNNKISRRNGRNPRDGFLREISRWQYSIC